MFTQQHPIKRKDVQCPRVLSIDCLQIEEIIRGTVSGRQRVIRSPVALSGRWMVSRQELLPHKGLWRSSGAPVDLAGFKTA